MMSVGFAGLGYAGYSKANERGFAAIIFGRQTNVERPPSAVSLLSRLSASGMAAICGLPGRPNLRTSEIAETVSFGVPSLLSLGFQAAAV